MRCPGCGFEAGDAARFCSACGAPLAPAAQERPPARLTGERRQLAVLFCDLVGSTPLSEQLDAEEFGDLVLEYQQAGAVAVEQLGGMVGNYLGDGLLAWFGWPVAHEDDAARCVEAGLALLRIVERVDRDQAAGLGVRLQARVGIHLGPAVVGEVAGAERPDTPAFGQTLNVAARLEGFAQPGTVVVSEAVRRVVGRRFVTRPAGTPELKGVSEPLPVHVIERVAEPGGDSRVHADVPLVARGGEIRVLRSAWERARQGGGCAVEVRGEPGVGKSRLISALRDEIGDEPSLWITLQCTPLGAHTAFAPLADAVRRTFGIDPSEPPERQRASLRAHLSGATAPIDLLEDLLGIAAPAPDATAVGGEALRHRLIEGLLAWLLSMAEQRPLVVAVEDVHWADPSTLEVLSLLHDRSEAARVLIVVTSRPEAPAALPDERLDRVALERLSAAEARRLAGELAALHGVDAARAAALAERADGVPLFVEELIAAAAETGDEATEIPATLQSSLAARLDRLGGAKVVAHVAAVLGRSFTADLLVAVADLPEDEVMDGLGRLVQAGLVGRRRDALQEVHEFRHALIRDAAYDTLLRRRRRELHLLAAAALKERFPERAAAEPELLGHHLEAGGHALEAAECFDTAGRRAASAGALAEAAAHYRRGLGLVEKLEPGPERDAREQSLLTMLGNALMGLEGIGAEATGEVWRRACEVTEARGDLQELTSTLNGLAVYELDQGELRRGVELGERILEIGGRIDYRVARLRGHGTIGIGLYFLGEGERALEHLRASAAHYRPGDFQLVTYGLGHDQGVAAHAVAAEALAWLGRPDEALEEAAAGAALAEEIGSFLSLAMARHFEAVVRHLRREHELAFRAAEANVAFCREMRFGWWEGLGHILAGAQRTMLGDAAGSEEILEGLALLGAVQSRSGMAFGLSLLAESQRAGGDPGTALATVEGALALEGPFRQHHYDAQLLRMHAELLLELEGRPALARVEELLREAIDVASTQGAVLFGLRAATSLARLLSQEERGSEGASVLAPWPQRVRGGAGTRDMAEAAELLASLAVQPVQVKEAT